MNISQKIFISAVQSAVSAPIDATQHDLDIGALEAFTATGHDKLDYPEWRREFNITRQNLIGQAQHKSPSEKAALAAPKLATA